VRHIESSFKGYKDFNIYYQAWLPEKKPIAVLILAHGLAGYSGRFIDVPAHLVPEGFAIYALDHRGHGRSDGERIKVDDFHDYVKDLKTFYNIVRKENPKDKIFLLGHSMGSGIALLYAFEYQKELAGLIITGGGVFRPTVDPMPRPPSGGSVPLSILIRDPAALKACETDPLVYRGPVTDEFYVMMSSVITRLYDLVLQIKLPILIMAGDGGRDGSNSQVLYERVASKDKTLKLYEGLLHELFNEPEHPQILADLEAWVKHLL
jgi:acylglycerol lipase